MRNYAEETSARVEYIRAYLKSSGARGIGYGNSGGKDSEVCLELCRRAHIPLEVIHHLTTADAPETIYHVRNVFRQLELEGIACAFHKPFTEENPPVCGA